MHALERDATRTKESVNAIHATRGVAHDDFVCLDELTQCGERSCFFEGSFPQRTDAHSFGERVCIFLVVLGASSLVEMDDGDLRDMRVQDFVQPERLRALLEAEVFGASNPLEGVDQRLAVRVDDPRRELFALGIEHDERAACLVNIESDIFLHRRPPGLERGCGSQLQSFFPRLEGATLSCVFQAAQTFALPA